MKVKLISIDGNIENVPFGKTYGWFPDKSTIVYAKIEVTKRGLRSERIHYLYRNKKGYYCIVCKQKCYFTNDEINSVYKESEVEHKY